MLATDCLLETVRSISWCRETSVEDSLCSTKEAQSLHQAEQGTRKQGTAQLSERLLASLTPAS